MEKKKRKGCLIPCVIVAVIFIAALCFGISRIALNPEQHQKPQESQFTDGDASTMDDFYKIGDSAVLKDWTITITDAKIVDSISLNYGSYSPEEDGDKYLQLFVSVENNGKQSAQFLPPISVGNSVSTKLIYNNEYEFSSTNLLGYQNDLHTSTVNPLSSRTGEIIFEVSPAVAEGTEELFVEFISGTNSIKIKIR